MNVEIGFIIDAADKNMRFSIEHLEKELLKNFCLRLVSMKMKQFITATKALMNFLK